MHLTIIVHSTGAQRGFDRPVCRQSNLWPVDSKRFRQFQYISLSQIYACKYIFLRMGPLDLPESQRGSWQKKKGSLRTPVLETWDLWKNDY